MAGTDTSAAPEGRTRELVVGALATLYTAFLLFAAGPKFILVSFIIYAPATILFVMAIVGFTDLVVAALNRG